jgi:antibiotic biosynthesis monooxygenase (ABM) superfamily enzyme
MKTKRKLITALKIWVAIYPSITLFLYLFGKSISDLPLYQRTCILTLFLVPFMVFIILPLIDLIIGVISTKENKL